MKEKRIRERRFSLHSGQSFPFPHVSGRIVHEDRRRTADRRLNNICLEPVSVACAELPPHWAHATYHSAKKPAP